jgi:hypothetical protein
MEQSPASLLTVQSDKKQHPLKAIVDHTLDPPNRKTPPLTETGMWER